MKKIKSVNIIGSGNVASHFAFAFKAKDISVKCIYSRTLENAQKLADDIKTSYTDNLDDLKDVDLTLIAIKDDAIEEISKKLYTKSIVVHSSGSVSINALNSHFDNGIFYPLQTFSKEKEVDWQNLPICVESSDVNTKEILIKLAKKLSSNVHYLTSEQRKKAHLSAVIACNFSNHFYALAYKLMQENEIDFQLIEPLIKATANKVGTENPALLQTGPAVRKDTDTINKHIEMLDDSSDLQKLYQDISNSIIKTNEEL